MPDAFSFNDIGLTLQSAAGAINDFVQDNLTSLDFHEIQQLTNCAQDLLIKSKALFAQSATAIEDSAKDAITSLTTANADINKAIAKVTNIQQAVNIAGNLVGIGASILSQSWGNIPGFAQSALVEVKTVLGGGGAA